MTTSQSSMPRGSQQDYFGNLPAYIAASTQAKTFAVKEEHDAKVRNVEASPSYGIKPSRADLIVTLSQRLFVAREKFHMLGAMNRPSDRDADMKAKIEYDLARAVMLQAENDLNKAIQPV